MKVLNVLCLIIITLSTSAQVHHSFDNTYLQTKKGRFNYYSPKTPASFNANHYQNNLSKPNCADYTIETTSEDILSQNLCRSANTIPLVYNYLDNMSPNRNEWSNKCFFWNNTILSLGNAVLDSTGRRGFTLICYDTYGNKIWDKVYQDTAYYIIQGNDIEILNNDYFYVGGILYNPGLTPWDRFLAKFDANGNNVFFQAYLDTSSTFLVDLEKFSDDTLLALSVSQDSLNDEYCRIILEFIDTNGNILYETMGQAELKYPDQVINHNGFIYVGGTKKTQPGNNYQVKVFINRYNHNLTQVGSTTPSITPNEYFLSLTSVKTQLYLTSSVSAWFYPDPRKHFQPNISKLTNLGHLVDTNRFGTPYISWPTNGPSINVADKMLATPENFSDIKIYFHDLDLNLLCSFKVNDAPVAGLDYVVLRNLAYVPPNKIAGTGEADRGTPFSDDQWNFLTEDIISLVKTNCSPMFVEDECFASLGSVFQVFPTISDGFINVIRMHNNPEQVTLKVYDMNGRMCVTKEFLDSTVLDVHGFPSGLYIVHIGYGHNCESHRFVIK